MIIIQWLIGLLVPVVPFFIKDSYELEKESRACRLTSHTPAGSLYGTITIYVVPLSAVIIVYEIIFYRVRQSTRRVWAIAPTVIRLPANNNVAAPNMKRSGGNAAITAVIPIIKVEEMINQTFRIIGDT
ncbi:unnamed protein product [Rotaria sp. Silwood2]|nr:unnamed protein product [Rotaria sp. Silwood2]